MIQEETIEKVQLDLDIADVVAQYGVTLDNHNKGLCPFHEEKTPSFHVYPRTNSYYCWGCQASGGIIRFVQEKMQLNFPDAVKALAEKYSLPVLYVQDTTEEKERRSKREEQEKLMAATVEDYHALLMDLQPDDEEKIWYMAKLQEWDPKRKQTVKPSPEFARVLNEIDRRGWDLKTLLEWKIGLAPEDGKYLTRKLAHTSYYEAAIATGLLSDKNGRSFDGYRDRLLVPLMDTRRLPIGFAGRSLSAEIKPQFKWINPPVKDANLLYQKKRFLFGLDKAANAIKKDGFAILVEGYTDVIALHLEGFENSVAASGTSLDSQQLRMLRRLTDTLVLMFDGDEAGRKGQDKILEKALNQDFRVLQVELPDGQDPDSFRRTHAIGDWIAHSRKDMVLEAIRKNLKDAGEDPHEIQQAYDRAALLLIQIHRPAKRDQYQELLANYCEDIGWKKKYLTAAVKELSKIDEQTIRKAEAPRVDNLPYGLKYEEVAEEVETHGFFVHAGEYYVVHEKDKFNPRPRAERVSNFTLEMLYHVNGKNPRRIIMIENNEGVKKVLQPTPEDLASWNNLRTLVSNNGNFQWKVADRAIHDKFLFYWMNRMGEGEILEVLGWQRDRKWFAFNNGAIWKGKYIPYNQYGILTLDTHHYYIPSANPIIIGQNLFSAQKKLKFMQAGVPWETYQQKFLAAYGQGGMVGLIFACACLYSDFIFEANHENFPLYMVVGPPDTGKGSLVKSIQRLWGESQMAINITGVSTAKAKISEFAAFENYLIFLEEYRDGLDIEATQWLMGLADRLGYKRKNKDYEYANEEIPIRSGVAITGNDYPSYPALLSRVICNIYIINKSDEEARQRYREYKDVERQGISSFLLPLLAQRPQIEAHYTEYRAAAYTDCRKELNGLPIMDRLVENITTLLGVYQCLSPHIPFQFTYEDLRDHLLDIIREQHRHMPDTDPTVPFWNTLLWLVKERKVFEGQHFRIKKGMVAIRFTSIYPDYRQWVERLTGQRPMESEQLREQLKKSSAYEESKDSYRYGKVKNSAMIFREDGIPIRLAESLPDYEITELDDTKQIKVPTKESGNGTEKLPF